jgi:hypothetical protein
MNESGAEPIEQRTYSRANKIDLFRRVIAACMGVSLATGFGLVAMVILTAGGTVASVLLIVYLVGGLVGWLAYVKTGWPFGAG